MKRKLLSSKKAIIIINILLLLIIVTCVAVLLVWGGERDSVAKLDKIISNAVVEDLVEDSKPELHDRVDFDYLKSVNEDIYAWVYIPGADVDYPIVNRQGDNSYYLRHDFSGKESKFGAIFTENYNSTTFKDSVTVVYGHNMRTDDQFGSLSSYKDKDFFDKHQKMVIFTPKKNLTYSLVMVTPYYSNHILYNQNFDIDSIFNKKFSELKNIRSLNTYIVEDCDISFGDKVVILSTCYYQNPFSRYLLVWKLVN